MYDVWAMKRTNIYLEADQLKALRRVAEQRGLPVAELVRSAVTEWLRGQGVREISEDEWEQRFAVLLSRRETVARRGAFDADEVARDVAAAVRAVRGSHVARRH